MVVDASLRVGAKVKGRVMGQRFSTKGNDAHASLRRRLEAGAIYETTAGAYRFRVSERAASRVELIRETLRSARRF